MVTTILEETTGNHILHKNIYDTRKAPKKLDPSYSKV